MIENSNMTHSNWSWCVGWLVLILMSNVVTLMRFPELVKGMVLKLRWYDHLGGLKLEHISTYAVVCIRISTYMDTLIHVSHTYLYVCTCMYVYMNCKHNHQ